MSKKSKITINTSFGEIENIEIKEIIKQRTTYRQIICCATTDRMNDVGEKIFCKYGESGTPKFMGKISAVGNAEEIRKGIRNCRKMESLQKLV